jgi:membrane protease YdiL (CAAX protease family)
VALGFFWGGLLVALTVAIPWLSGHERLGGPEVGASALLVGALRDLGALVPQSAAEEIFLRGYALTHLRRGVGSVLAVLLTGSLFGILHLGNPNVSRMAIINIALVGIFLGAVVVRTGSLWTTIGLHIAWNWFEGFFFGHPVSGIQAGTSLFHRIAPSGDAWTGGGFGPEASVPTAVVVAAMLAGTLLWRTKSS